MRRGTLVVLALVVVLLLLARRAREGGRAAEGAPPGQALFPGLVAERVLGVRIDHLERAQQLHLERDAAGTWYLTEPVAYPADGALVRALLVTLESSRVEPLAGADAALLGLDPPRAVLEATWSEDGDLRTGRLELGALDLDPRLIHARVPGHPGGELVRLERTVWNTLERTSDDFRDPRLTPLRGAQVRALRRSGALALEAGAAPVALELEAELGERGWRHASAPSVALDPSGIGALVRVAAELRAVRFTDDSPESLAPYGLDDPELRVELVDERGQSLSLSFARAARERGRAPEDVAWYATRSGQPTVFEVRWNDVLVLAQPRVNLYDYQLLRAPRDELERIELEHGGVRLVLERADDDWSVHVEEGGGAAGPVADSTRYPAHHGAVADLLALLEGPAIGAYLEGQAFEEGLVPASVTVLARDGRVFGGRFGAAGRDPDTGAEGRLFLRFGDDLPGLVDPELAASCDRELAELRRLQVHRHAEGTLSALTLVLGDTERAYARRGDADWYPADVHTKLPPGSRFFPVLEHLSSLAVEAWLPDGEQPACVERIEVELAGDFGHERFALGRTADGRTVCLLPDGEAALWRADLYQQVRGLFD